MLVIWKTLGRDCRGRSGNINGTAADGWRLLIYPAAGGDVPQPPPRPELRRRFFSSPRTDGRAPCCASVGAMDQPPSGAARLHAAGPRGHRLIPNLIRGWLVVCVTARRARGGDVRLGATAVAPGMIASRLPRDAARFPHDLRGRGGRRRCGRRLRARFRQPWRTPPTSRAWRQRDGTRDKESTINAWRFLARHRREGLWRSPGARIRHQGPCFSTRGSAAPVPAARPPVPVGPRSAASRSGWCRSA